jgi:hypothetical protein
MFKKPSIQPMQPASPLRSRSGEAVDHIAAASGVPVLILAAAQLLAPSMATPLTGLEAGTASAILAAQWAALGGLLLFGGVTQTRAVAIFAADFLIIAGLAGAIVCLFTQSSLTAIITHGIIAALGFLTSSLSRLTDKADLKRELIMMREQASHEREPASPTPPLRQPEDSARSGQYRNGDQTSGPDLAEAQTSHGADDGQ